VNSLFVADANNAAGFIHKSKLNANGSFSVGKTWNLTDLRGVEVANVCDKASAVVLFSSYECRSLSTLISL
jgi:Exocyst complex component SEC3 N-terminal PIP2 binding PH